MILDDSRIFGILSGDESSIFIWDISALHQHSDREPRTSEFKLSPIAIAQAYSDPRGRKSTGRVSPHFTPFHHDRRGPVPSVVMVQETLDVDGEYTRVSAITTRRLCAVARKRKKPHIPWNEWKDLLEFVDPKPWKNDDYFCGSSGYRFLKGVGQDLAGGVQLYDLGLKRSTSLGAATTLHLQGIDPTVTDVALSEDHVVVINVEPLNYEGRRWSDFHLSGVVPVVVDNLKRWMSGAKRNSRQNTGARDQLKGGGPLI